MSIQLKLSGHSFSLEVPSAGIPEECAVYTARTLLLPRDEFDAAQAELCLRLAGMACRADERPVHSDPQQQIVAVMPVPAAAVETVRRQFGPQTPFTTPLLTLRKYTEPTVWFYRAGTLLYIKVYDTLLRLAEAIEAPGDADLLCAAERLTREFPAEHYAAAVEGDEPHRLRRLLQRYFKRVTCE